MKEKFEVYMDNSATTKPYPEVVDIMVDTMRTYYGNPSSSHIEGLKGEKKINECRENIARTLNCSKEEIIFTSGGSESNNFLIRGFVKEGNHIITSKIEHPSVLNTCIQLEKEGVQVTYLNTDDKGKINLEELANNISKNTVLVSLMCVNNEIGTIQDIESIGKIIKEKSSRAKFHVDAVQSYGKLEIDVKKSKIDLLSASGHKIYGPKGIGIAYVKKGLNPKPLIYGGSQEKSLRAGTENLPAILGFAYAAERMKKESRENFNKVKEIKDNFIGRIKNLEKTKINSEGDEFSPYILSLSFEGIKGEVLLHMLEEKGIYVSTGSACSSKQQEESSTLKSIGLNSKEIQGTIRFSFSYENSIEEVDYVVENLEQSLKFLRRIGR